MDDADLGCDKFLACAGELDYIIFGICKPDTLLRSQVSSPACNHALRASGRIRNTPMKFLNGFRAIMRSLRKNRMVQGVGISRFFKWKGESVFNIQHGRTGLEGSA